MLEFLYQKTKITERTLRPAAIFRMRFFTTLVVILTPLFTVVKFTSVFESLGPQFELVVSLLLLASVVPLAFNRLANMMIFTDKRLDEWEIRVKKRAEAFAYRTVMFGLMALAVTFTVFVDTDAFKQKQFGFGEVMLFPVTLFFLVAILPALYASWAQKPLEPGEDVESLSDIVV